MKIAIGSDHAGFHYKEKIKELLKDLRHEVHDFGTYSEDPVDYPLFVRPVAAAVALGDYERGIVLGGSGNGEAMVANRIPRIRCALCWNVETALLARKHNDANMLSLGERMISEETALEIVRVWLSTPFDGGRHLRRIIQIDHGEASTHPGEGDTSDTTRKRRTWKKDRPPLTPGPEKYDVFISFRYIVYSEGENAIEFKVEPGLKGPSVIQVPSPERWQGKLPDWAKERRGEILDRIRSKCSHMKYEFKEY
jgi:ribose 5-phosphate isomerase B